MSRFEGKVAIVTGGAVGIGRATAQRLAAEGARVSIGDRDGEGARKTASEIGENALGLTCDVGIQGDVEHLVDQTVKRFGRLDVLVNNRGYVSPRPRGFRDRPRAVGSPDPGKPYRAVLRMPRRHSAHESTGWRRHCEYRLRFRNAW